MSSSRCSVVGYARLDKGPTPNLSTLGCSLSANGLYVYRNERPFLPNPSFWLQALTTTFFLDEAAGSSLVEFDLNGKDLGKLIHVSGAEARDYGQEITQTLTSMHVSCEWGSKGLKLSAEGHVAARSELLSEIRSDLYNVSYYEIALAVSWESLRILFEAKPTFVQRMITRFAR